MAQNFELQRTIGEGPITVLGPEGQKEEVTLGLYEVTKTFQGVTKVTHFVTTSASGDGVLKDSNVRLYLPLRASYNPTDDEIIKLFKGEKLFLKDLKKKDGGTYSANFIFDLWADRSFTDRNGQIRTPNFTGDLKFAPRDN
jgi:hypothetical protein